MTSLAGQLHAIELAFDPHELRIPKGQPRAGEWVHTPSAKPGTGIHRYVVPDPERLVIPPPKKPRKNYYVRPEDQPFFQAHPVSPENILRAYDAADEGTRAQGRDWYRQNHEVAKTIGGGNAEKGAILLSAYTAQKPWPYNMFQAMKSFNRGKALGPGEGMAITGANQRTAQAALDGAGIDKALHGPKTHSFAVLLAQGDDSPDDPYGHVVIDTHALNVAAGGNVRGDALDDAPIGGPRYHQYVADQYREAARRVSEREGKLMKPHELQAITWMVQQQANQAADAAAAASGKLTKGELGRARGRVNMTKNAWKVWMAYAKKHNVQLVPGLSSLAGQAALAQLIELASDDSILAQLTYPVRTLDGVDLAFDPKEPRDPATGKWTAETFTGQLPVSLLHPTEDTSANERWERRGAGWKYQQEMVEQVSGHGMPGPVEVDYHAGGPTMEGRSKTPRYYIRQGHHRFYAARQLGMTHVPVVVKSYHGHPPDLVELSSDGHDACPDCGCLTAQLLEPPPFTGSGLATELAAWTHERRGPDGRWVRGISTQILDPFYNELPESGLRGTVRSKGTFGGQGGRDLEDAARIRAYRREHPVQPNPITAAEARGNSRPVSMDEYQALAAQGLNRLGQLSQKTGHGGLTRHWDEIKAKTYPKVLEPWGGATIDSKTGVPLEDGVDAYAITVKPAGMEHVSIPEGASEAQFNAAMDQALARFGAELDRQQRYLGVFHDDENHRIDIDPVLVVSTLAEVEQIGSYTRAVGGAYRFSDGNGYWPPHVAEGAALAADGGTVHFEGPGQWRSQAAEAQDGLSPEQQAEIDAADDGLDED